MRFDTNLNKAMSNFTPEKKSYETSVNSTGLFSFFIAAIISFLGVVYIIMRFGYSAYQKPESPNLLKTMPPLLLVYSGATLLVIGLLVNLVSWDRVR
jgi:flagellar biogenesis protein FliO